jgi:hypothetical protein
MSKRDFGRCLRFFIGLMIFVALLILLLRCRPAQAQEVEEPEGAVAYLLSNGNIPKKDVRWKEATEIEKILIEAAELEGIDPALFVAMAYRESSFTPSAIGKLGEIGLFQVHGKAARKCDLKTVAGQAACGARWLARVIAECGGYVVLDSKRCQKTLSQAACSGGLAAYASGSCQARTKRTAWLIRARLKLADELRPRLLGQEKREAILASGGF